jgi:hypothetical protein
MIQLLSPRMHYLRVVVVALANSGRGGLLVASVVGNLTALARTL